MTTLENCKTIAHIMPFNTPKVGMASGTLQYQTYHMAVDHVCKQIESNEVTMLYEVTDSEEKLEDAAKQSFHDLKMRTISLSMLIIMMSLEMIFWSAAEVKEPVTLTFNKVE